MGFEPGARSPTQRVPRLRIGERLSDMGLGACAVSPADQLAVTHKGRGGVYRRCCYSYKIPHEPSDGVIWVIRGACKNLYPYCSAGSSS